MTAPKLKPLSEQVILITGASSGIGLVTARMAAARGAKVVLVSRAEPALQAIVAGIQAAGGTAAYAVADVGDHGAVRAAARCAIERFGRIDSWVNNAGVAIYAGLLDTPMNEHERLMRTNYLGAVHGALTAIEHLRTHGGALITVGSIVSDLPTAVMGVYAASKHAVKGYIDSLRIEVNAAALPVSITLIKPSGIDTPIGRHAANHLRGEALIPPPAYAPELVAEAILDAAVRPRREVTIGGVGRLEVLIGEHFPALLDRFGGLLAPFLHDPSRPRTTSDNLEAPMADGEERSATDSGRSFSIYDTANRHKPLVALAAATLLGGLALNRRRLSRPANRRSGDRKSR